MLTLRDPIHGFIRADAMEAALIDSRPLQRLRSIHQLGFTWLVFPGAEHSRFSHALGAMELAGRLYDSVAAKGDGQPLDGVRQQNRRLVRAAALLHDVGHAPFSHSAEGLIQDELDHESMTARLLRLPEIEEIFAQYGEGVGVSDVAGLLAGGEGAERRLMAQMISGELDVDKMDYLLRDSLYCGVRYGSYDLDRLLDTIVPLHDPVTGEWGLGVEEGGVHALEALVMARYYMFTQVYFNLTGKALELHFNRWLQETGRRWPAEPEEFLEHDDLSVLQEMRRDETVHARAVVTRQHFPLAWQSREHLEAGEGARVREVLHELEAEFGKHQVLISHSAKDPHRLGSARVLVRRWNGELEPMEAASHFIRHLERINRYRLYGAPEIRDQLARTVTERLG